MKSERRKERKKKKERNKKSRKDKNAQVNNYLNIKHIFRSISSLK